MSIIFRNALGVSQSCQPMSTIVIVAGWMVRMVMKMLRCGGIDEEDDGSDGAEGDCSDDD